MDYPYGSGYSVAPSSTPPSYPISLSSITTTKVLTESTTATSYTTSTLLPYPPKDIVSAIEGLAECSQTILFENLANSKCNPADFACICTTLKTLTIEAKIGQACSLIDKAQYIVFQNDVCSGIYPTPPPVSPSSIIATASSSSIIITPSSSSIISTPSSSKPMSMSVIPIYNTTIVTKNDTTTTLPVRITSTQIVQLTTTDAAGKPTTIIQTVIPPGGAYPTGPTTPVPSEYTGGAGSMKMAALAGAVGFLGLVFAAF